MPVILRLCRGHWGWRCKGEGVNVLFSMFRKGGELLEYREECFFYTVLKKLAAYGEDLKAAC